MAKLDLAALNDPLNEYEVIEPRTTGFWLTLGSLVFVLAGIFMLRQKDPVQTMIAWGTLIFFGLCLLVGLLKLFGKADSLKFDQNGLTYTSLGRPVRIEWDHVAEFGTYINGPAFLGTKMIGMNMTEAQKTKATAMASALVGFDGALPTTYGVKATVLADALQTRLEAYWARC